MMYGTENGKDYSAHTWKIDVDVYIYDETPITDAAIDAYVSEIAKTLRGDFFVDYGCGDRGFYFWADDADEALLTAILARLSGIGCIVEYPDWYYINGVDETGDNQ